MKLNFMTLNGNFLKKIFFSNIFFCREHAMNLKKDVIAKLATTENVRKKL